MIGYEKLDLFDIPTFKVKWKVLGIFDLGGFLLYEGCTVVLIEDAFKDVSSIFNIGSGIATSWNELAKALFNALEMPVKIEYIDMPKELDKQYQNFTKADMSKFQKIYKDKFEITSIEDSVKDYVQNYLLKRERW